MANDVVLGAAMRSNLLTLQNTQRNIDATQLRLATGKKINSALDGPQSFFTSQSLNNRASDLTRLLDGIGQSIRTIEEADKGVTALSNLLTQADSIVSSARDALASSDGEARMVGTVDLRNVSDLVGFGGIQAADALVIETTDNAGQNITESIAITAGDTAYTLAAKITNAFADNHNGEIRARVDDKTGYLSITSTGGRSFKIGDGAADAAGAGLGAAAYDALGIGRYFAPEMRVAADSVNATIVGGNTVSTISLYEAPGNLVDAGDTLMNNTLTNANGTTVMAGITAGDDLVFTINDDTTLRATIDIQTNTSWQDVVDQINQSTAINGLVRANFNSNTGSIEITSLSDSVENFNIGYVTAGTTGVMNLGWGDVSGNLDPYGAAALAAGTYETNVAFNTSTESLEKFAKDFNTIRDQINDLVKDANYRGVNLLNGDNLTTFFNEDNSSRLTTEGAVFTAEGLGLVVANFTSAEAVESMATLTKAAINEVRSFGSSLANNLSIIQTRQTFTEETINTLKAGASDLTDADLNEEGATLLALQTAQQLGVTSLSLASQSQQSVLRLF